MDTTTNIPAVAMFLIVDLYIMFSIEFICMCTIYLHIKFGVAYFNYSVIIIIPKAIGFESKLAGEQTDTTSPASDHFVHFGQRTST